MENGKSSPGVKDP